MRQAGMSLHPCAGVRWLNTCTKTGFGAMAQWLEPCDLRREVMNDHLRGNHLLGIRPYDNRLERWECSAIGYRANIYAKQGERNGNKNA